MTASKIEQEILGLAVEDYYRLDEVYARVRKSLDGNDDLRRRGQLREVVQGLLSKGLLALYRGTAFAGEETEIEPKEHAAVLADDETWRGHAGKKAGHVRIAATDRGEREYYGS